MLLVAVLHVQVYRGGDDESKCVVGNISGGLANAYKLRSKTLTGLPLMPTGRSEEEFELRSRLLNFESKVLFFRKFDQDICTRHVISVLVLRSTFVAERHIIDPLSGGYHSLFIR